MLSTVIEPMERGDFVVFIGTCLIHGSGDVTRLPRGTYAYANDPFYLLLVSRASITSTFLVLHRTTESQECTHGGHLKHRILGESIEIIEEIWSRITNICVHVHRIRMLERTLRCGMYPVIFAVFTPRSLATHSPTS